jgi:hypothetical protein
VDPSVSHRGFENGDLSEYCGSQGPYQIDQTSKNRGQESLARGIQWLLVKEEEV